MAKPDLHIVEDTENVEHIHVVFWTLESLLRKVSGHNMETYQMVNNDVVIVLKAVSSLAWQRLINGKGMRGRAVYVFRIVDHRPMLCVSRLWFNDEVGALHIRMSSEQESRDAYQKMDMLKQTGNSSNYFWKEVPVIPGE